MFIENLSDLVILKTLMLHHVAPVTGRVADTEKNRSIELPRAFERLGAPGIPVHRVVGVLPQIRAGFVDEAVGELRLRRHGALPGRRLRASSCNFMKAQGLGAS